jgi:hypothetical protein
MTRANGTRDFRLELATVKLWDARCEQELASRGEALVDRPLQNREELIDLCRFIEQENIRSYLEIGVWTGALVRLLHRLFAFDRVAACDQGYAEERGLPIRLPGGTAFYRGDSESPGYVEFRRELGHVDLVLIDGNHAYHAVKADLARELSHPHRFIALHDITGRRRQTTGVARAWREAKSNLKTEIIHPQTELGLDHSLMGIGILE